MYVRGLLVPPLAVADMVIFWVSFGVGIDESFHL